jgi:dynein heavy chain 1
MSTYSIQSNQPTTAASTDQGGQGDGESQLVITHVVLEPWVHEIVLRNQRLQLEPPLEASRAMWFASLHDCLSTVTDLPRLKSSRYDDVLLSQGGGGGTGANRMNGVNEGGGNSGGGDGGARANGLGENSTYAHLLSKLDNSVLLRAYDLIEKVLRNVESYMSTWLRYQALWDLETTDALAFLGQVRV